MESPFFVRMFAGIAEKRKLSNGLVGVFELEDGVGGFLEIAGYLEGEDGGGNVFAGLDGVDGLAADSDGFRKLLLGNVHYGSFDSYGIFHVNFSPSLLFLPCSVLSKVSL